MSRHLAVMNAKDNVIRAALRVISADHYERDGDPHADAEAEHAAELLALAAREHARAVDQLPGDEQPIGWQPDVSSVNPEPTLADLQAANEQLLDRVADLEADSRKLHALQAAGVDNWQGYGDAMAALYDDEDED